MKIVTDVTSSVVTPITTEVDGETRKVFVTLDPALNAYYTLASAFTPSGDFEIEFSISTVNTTEAFQSVTSGSANGSNEIAIFTRSSGEVRVLAYVGSTLQTIIDTSGVTANDGKLHNIKLTHIGTSAELFVDDVSEGSATWALDGSQDVKYVGSRNGSSQYFDGIVSDVKLTDLATSANSLHYVLNQITANTEESLINSNTLTYVNIPGSDRETFIYDSVNDQWVGDSQTIEIA